MVIAEIKLPAIKAGTILLRIVFWISLLVFLFLYYPPVIIFLIFYIVDQKRQEYITSLTNDTL